MAADVAAIQPGITQSAADDRYLQLSGGEVTGPIQIITKGGASSASGKIEFAGFSVQMGWNSVQGDFSYFKKEIGPKICTAPQITAPGTTALESSDIHRCLLIENLKGFIIKSDISLDGNRIRYLGNPTEDTDAANKAYVDAHLPSGVIVMWSGAATAIPSGWALCNGSNGTPDLRDRFVVGAGSSYAVGAKGGEKTHTLTNAEMPNHSHNLGMMPGASYSSNPMGGIVPMVSTRDAGDMICTEYAGLGSAHNNMPPYYALCFIMRL